MSVSSMDLQDVDILSDSLSLVGEDYATAMRDEGLVRYGDLVLNIAPKEGKALTLLADQLFSPSLLFAELIERGLIPLGGKTVVELGAGCALPSILAATLSTPPALIVITDYPDEAILANLRINLHANERLISSGCSVACVGHEWGTDAGPVLNLLKLHSRPSIAGVGFDVVLLSDLLHFHNSHGAILASLTAVLARNSTARAYVASGTYTPDLVCANFARLAAIAGLVLTESAPDDEWQGSREVWRLGKLSVNDLGIRKAMCRWWVARWDEKALAVEGFQS